MESRVFRLWHCIPSRMFELLEYELSIVLRERFGCTRGAMEKNIRGHGEDIDRGYPRVLPTHCVSFQDTLEM
jgi:hypothetical protein